MNEIADNAYAHLHPIENTSYVHSESMEEFRHAFYILIFISHSYIDFWHFSIL